MEKYKLYKELATANKTLSFQFEIFAQEILSQMVKEGKFLKAKKYNKVSRSLEITSPFSKSPVPTEDLYAELYVKYYRGLQLFILPESCRKMALEIALETSLTDCAKVIQKAFDLELTGTIGPVERHYMQHCTPAKLQKVKKSVWYKWRKVINKFY